MRGLVLEGGGAKGAFHCGAVKALYDYGYTFNGVAGTSIGAINAALIVQDGNYSSMYDLWNNIGLSDITDFNDDEVNRLFGKEYSPHTVKYWAKALASVVSNGGMATDKTMAYLKKYIDEDKVRRSKMDLAIVTYCISDRRPLELFKEEIPIGSLHNYIFASAHFPAFKFQRFDDGKYYIDGGVYDNLPLNILTKKGYDEIIAVRTMSRMPHKEIENTKITVDYICPSENLGKTMKFYPRSIKNNIKLGYYDALRFIKGYNGYKYYIDGKIDLPIKIINKTDKKHQTEICNILRISENDFYNGFRTKIIEEYKLTNCTDDEIFLYFFEMFAKFYGVEKFKIYKQDEFFFTLIKKSSNRIIKEPSAFSRRFRDRTKLFLIFRKLLPMIMEVING